MIRPDVALLRLKWARDHEHWGYRQWLRIIWSDECSVELGKGKKRVWVFRTPKQKWDKEMIEPYHKRKLGSVMIWGAFWGKGDRSDLVRMIRDEKAKKKGYSAESYIHVLEDQLPTIVNDGLILMQDNAPIHKARIITQYLEENDIEVMDWPPYSPDLNPIEHIWKKLKEKAWELRPELFREGQSLEDRLDELHETLEREWHMIAKDLMRKLGRSMQRRVKAVIKAKGWYTKY